MYNAIIKRFPRGIQYAFAYGSGVKQQKGYDQTLKESSMIDLILCIKNPSSWHKENLSKNSNDYSSLKLLGSKFVSNFQESGGARVYFNTLVPLDNGKYIKYGVISSTNLFDDLMNWKFLYVAGRLHKPVQDILPCTCNKINEAKVKNLINAFRASLIILPEQFTDFELFYTISNLSYAGDFRMKFGENKHKVRNIVEAQIDDFYELYLPSLRKFSKYVATLHGKKLFEQDKSQIALDNHLRNLPKELLHRVLINSGNREGLTDGFNKVLYSNYQNIVLKSINQIVLKSSITQSIKNIPSAGILKSFNYSTRKIKKMLENL